MHLILCVWQTKYKPKRAASAMNQRLAINRGKTLAHSVSQGFCMHDVKTSFSARSARLAFLACLAAASFTRAASNTSPTPAGSAAAQTPAATQQHNHAKIAPQYAELARKLTKGLPEYSIVRISPSGVDGILEVLMEDNRIV